MQGSLGDPTPTIYDAGGNQVYFNDNWFDSEFPTINGSNYMPASRSESTIIISLVPGAYTAMVKGANNTTGIGRVDIFDNN